MKLKSYLKQHKLTQRELAEKLGVHHNSIWALVNGSNRSPKLAKRIEEFTRGEVTRWEIIYPHEYD